MFKNKILFTLLLILIFISVLFFNNNKSEVVSNFPLEHEDRINKILSNMSLEEKVGQTCQITLDAILIKNKSGVLIEPHSIDSAKLHEAIHKYKIGSILNVSDHTFTLENWHKKLKKIHDCTNLQSNSIPIIYGIDAIHGANYIQNSTLFPQEIGLAASWDTSIARAMGLVTAYETRASGIAWNFSPVLDLGRTPIWSRFFETLGEDVYLAKTLGKKIVEGYQGDFPISHNNVAACLKHYVGYSYPHTGRDRTPALIPNRTMEELYLPPFKESIDAGALTVMINSGEVNGIPGHANKYLITDILKNKWGFSGFAVSDWEDFIKLHTELQTDSTIKDAIATAINAGVDMSMVPNNPQYKKYCENLIELVNEGRVSKNRLNDAVKRILRVKAELGILDKKEFDNTIYTDFASDKFKKLAYKSAAESITLLKNEDKILPIDNNKSVLLIGPAANSLNVLNGAWTHTWQGIKDKYNNDYPTIKEEIENRFSTVYYFEGSKMLMQNGDELDIESKDLSKAVSIASKLDYAIVCLGELPSTERPGDIYSLNMPQEQLKIVEELNKTGVPIILVLVEGRPKIINKIEPYCSAILQAYLPGDQGAKAIVDILLGDINPSGKLPYTYPRHDGVIMHYDHKQSELINGNNWSNDFFDPQFKFGFGLSYTNFTYTNLELSSNKISNKEILKIKIDVENTGDLKGKEVVQLYVRDHYATISPSLRKLKRFTKIELEPNQKKTVEFEITKSDLKFYGINNDWVVEDGKFSVIINDLKAEFNFKN